MTTLFAFPGYCILTSDTQETETSPTGLYIPETARENQHMLFGTVVSYGGPKETTGKPAILQSGDKVAVFKNKAARFTHNGTEHYLVIEGDILFALDDE